MKDLICKKKKKITKACTLRTLVESHYSWKKEKETTPNLHYFSKVTILIQGGRALKTLT